MGCCEIRVTNSGVYCCDIKNIMVRQGCIYTIKSANFPVTPVLMQVGDEWVPTAITVGGDDTCVNIFKPGMYMLDFDCTTIQNTVAPEEGAMSLCFECVCPEDYGEILSMQLAELCEKIVAGDDTMAIMQIISQLQEICTKLLALISNLENVSESLTTLTSQLEAVLTALENLCTKIEDGFEAMLECFDEMKETLSSIESESVQTNENLQEIIELLTCTPATAKGVITSWGS
jgi:hypothetical protein